MTLGIKNMDRICLAVVLAVLGAGVYWVMAQDVRQQVRARNEKALLADQMKNLSIAESNLQQLKTMLSVNKKETRALNERIPESTDMGKFLKELDFLIKKRKIDLVTLQPTQKVKEGRYTRIPVRMIFNGAFVDVYHLLYDLETMNRMLVVEKINISKAGRDTRCRVDLTANIFER